VIYVAWPDDFKSADFKSKIFPFAFRG